MPSVEDDLVSEACSAFSWSEVVDSSEMLKMGSTSQSTLLKGPEEKSKELTRKE